MNKQIAFAFLVALVGAVACAEETKGTGESELQMEAGRHAASLKNGLIDLAIIGAKGAKHIGKEAQPTVNALGKTINEGSHSLGRHLKERLSNNKHVMDAWHGIKDSKHIEQAKEKLVPLAQKADAQYSKLAAEVKPLIEQGKEKAMPYLEQAEQKRQQLLAEHEARQAQLRQQQ